MHSTCYHSNMMGIYSWILRCNRDNIVNSDGMSFYVHQHEGLKLLVTQWCPYNIHLWQLQGLLNAAARLIARRRKFDSISSKKCDNLHWLRIQQRVDFKLSVLMFNCLRNLAPSYLMNMCRPVTSNRHRRRLHSAVHGGLIVPLMKAVHYGPRSFAVAGPSMWNELPAPLCNDELSAMSFRRQLKTELYIRAYYSH